ncbi:hypothetical protein KAFR_0K00850 [Kazachstania africana CBS 2517]|uniref:Acireductone dioxygenase n=1 Tax=Kazachstania africana (strain ATCC 22294 / BCRC 22015 / CBS 2517 / CECT 1963 / NBRC 1671 / NRRL Y-8276) TaxID=1071382 RepID=H2B1E0_KAZAF|nr:hypothetical protein KAFR_0K00850 [Kazachstania africana CBS 2517]CCF60440.1 hypothetical protein KAFR_0K00850 [Kazachstania africana CBS 2517]
MVEVYVHDNDDAIDFRERHDSGVPVNLAYLNTLNVFYSKITEETAVHELALRRNYKNHDTVDISLESFDNDSNKLESKLKEFYEEHLHEDEEIRYILDGSGFFDIRDPNSDKWIRIKVATYDMLIIPAGIYHRFTLDTNNQIKALRLFKDEPKWDAIVKSTKADNSIVRKQYLISMNY